MIRLSPRMRKEASMLTGQYFVCMFSHTFSSYSIFVTETQPNEEYSIVQNGFEYSD